MNDQPPWLLEAIPTYRLICPDSGELAGIEYRWNNGETGILWRGDPIDNFVRQPFQESGPRIR